MNDYVILFDENGQPYVAHGQIITNLKSGAKSVAKWVDGKKSRYFKTQEELKAFYNQGKQKAKQTVEKAKQKAKDWSGVTARENVKSASNAMRRARVTNNKDYSSYRTARRESIQKESDAIKADAAATMAGYGVDKAKNEAARARAEAAYDRKEYDKAEGSYKQQYDKYYGDENSVGKTMKRSVSKKEREAHEKDKESLSELDTRRKDAYKTLKADERQVAEATDAQRRAMSEKRMADKEAEKADRDYTVARQKRGDANLKVLESDVALMDAESAYRRAKAEYADTPLGKVDAAKQKVKEARKTINTYASDKLDDIKDWASDRAESAKEKFSGAKEKAKELVGSAKEKAGQATDAVKDAAANAADKAKGAASSVKSSYDRMKDDFAASKVNKEVKKAESDFRNFKSKYKAPDAGLFSFDTASGTTVRNKERYDYYTKQAEDTFAYINNNPNLSTSAKQQLLSEAQEYMEYAQKYAWKK